VVPIVLGKWRSYLKIGNSYYLAWWIYSKFPLAETHSPTITIFDESSPSDDFTLPKSVIYHPKNSLELGLALFAVAINLHMGEDLKNIVESLNRVKVGKTYMISHKGQKAIGRVTHVLYGLSHTRAGYSYGYGWSSRDWSNVSRITFTVEETIEGEPLEETVLEVSCFGREIT